MTYQDALHSILKSYTDGDIAYNTKLLSLGFLSVLELTPMDYETMSEVLQREEIGIRSVVRNYIKRGLVEVVDLRPSTQGGRRCNQYGVTRAGVALLHGYQRVQRTSSRTRRSEAYQELRDEHPDRTFSSIALLSAIHLTDGRASSLTTAMNINAPALMQQTARALEAGLVQVASHAPSPEGGRERVIASTPHGDRLMYIMMQL